ncbi:aldehyde ferredoxin oxidoreductase family protein [Candidatus Aerophobetes bacterium]|nr:aldehyde ferredoxin oxidoreductase family protein [Candidatus Aerophobetes bacterium]
MRKGYRGKILRVDLTRRKILIQSLDETDLEKFIGGSGLGAKFLYEEVPADTEPLSPENLLIFMAGPLVGSGTPGSGRHEVVFKSPLTGIFARSGVGGSFGVNLKRAGFDGIIISGRSSKPVYLLVYDGQVEIKDATHIWGKDTYESDRILREEIGRKATVAVIGPAGEGIVKIAGISHDGVHSRMAGRCGSGAVMGSKNLKAIVVYGKDKVDVAFPEKLNQYKKQILPHIKMVSEGMRKFGTAGGIPNYERIGNFPHKNWALSNWEEGANKISGQTMERTILTGRYACHDCPIACGRMVKVDEGPFAPVNGGGPEYETVAALGSLCLVDNIEAIARANELCNRLGLDTMSTGAVIAFAMEAFERGIITDKDTGGVELTWGNAQALLKMIEKIARKEDIGEVLSEGVRSAANKLGKNTVEFAIHIKGLEPSYHDPRCFFSHALNYATAARGGCHNGSQSHSCEITLSCPDLGINEPQDRHLVDGKAEFTMKLQNLMCFYDSLVLCKFFHTSGSLTPQQVVNFLNYTTGWDFNLQSAMEAGERIFNLQRMYNVRCGISRKDDTLPPRFLTLKREKDKLPPLGQLLSDYYELRGWDEMGIPTEQKLKELSLEKL